MRLRSSLVSLIPQCDQRTWATRARALLSFEVGRLFDYAILFALWNRLNLAIRLIDPLAKVGCEDRGKNLLRVRRSRGKPKEEPSPQERPFPEKLIDAVRQTVQRKRVFLPGRSFFTNTPDNIEILADLHEISLLECAAILRLPRKPWNYSNRGNPSSF